MGTPCGAPPGGPHKPVIPGSFARAFTPIEKRESSSFHHDKGPDSPPAADGFFPRSSPLDTWILRSGPSGDLAARYGSEAPMAGRFLPARQDGPVTRQDARAGFSWVSGALASIHLATFAKTDGKQRQQAEHARITSQPSGHRSRAAAARCRQCDHVSGGHTPDPARAELEGSRRHAGHENLSARRRSG